MNDLRILAPFSSSSGYSHMARAALSAAIHAGFNVQAIESDYRIETVYYVGGRQEEKRIYFRPGKGVLGHQRAEITRAKRNRVPLAAPTLFVQIPESLAGWHEYSSGPRIGWTMCEADRLNPIWKNAMQGVDLLLAPSRFCLEVFRREVPNIRAELCPIPVDDRAWTPTSETTEFNRRNLPSFIFFSVFNALPRKNWDLLIQAFAEEFAGQDVGLMVKANGCTDQVVQLAEWCNKINSAAREQTGQGFPSFFVQVIDKRMTNAELADYYRMCDCYVLPSAEGFGLPFVEAALCGKPSVALDGGGAADVVDESTGYLVPSHLEIKIGQLPHVYPYGSMFPSCDFYALKKVLRRAYDDRGARLQGKGDAARERALREFTPEAVAPIMRAMVEIGKLEHKETIGMWNGVGIAQYAICIGDGFGDAMASYANYRAVTKVRASFLHYGWNQGVSDWLAMQDGVCEVKRIEPHEKKDFHILANRAGGFYRRHVDTWLPHILAGTGIDPATVALTQVHWPWASWPVYRAPMVLGDAANAWADRQKAELGEFILVQPFSTSSVGIGEHWYYWPQFLHWLLGNCPHKMVFCGLNPIAGLVGENVVDMIGKCPSMMHMLALADRSQGVISTCNALANWTAITGTRGLIAGNAAVPRAEMYWRRFMGTPNNTVLDYTATLADMVKAAEGWLEGVGE